MERHFLRVQLTSRDASLDPECDIRGEHFPFSLYVQRIPLEAGAEAGPAHRHAHTASVAAEVARLDPNSGAPGSDNFLDPALRCMEFRCDVIEGELVVDQLLYHGTFDILGNESAERRHASCSSDAGKQEEEDKKVYYNNPFGGYQGPNLDEAEEEVLDGIQSYLAERKVDDQFGEFVSQMSVWVEQEEYERWLQQLYDYVAA
ncbi:complement component 1 Q subcomponent-binding protein, mitochondrial [Strigomonas culicis]|uniref:Complement component 1 Q subcomponent-binding protein, mitochondrial n=1 Tax=Strigomonas culicis TaxID=28005 RepID=S9VE45_9TRYP|nr:complement component 1 Q subcomponent-binding protein, mitochondrial [Strigomonas culicis]|eukprot:EPY21370.1 complement component 1 Q subcomponent-binding protein, mitochondrial [Strigomonas culicis]